LEKEELLTILREGAEIWNQWKSENHKLYPDLSSAFLSGANLSGADLSGANLNNADLGGANLNNADLSGANLSEANLSGTHFEGANLSWAILNRANLSGALLNRACLSGAHLLNANLNKANLPMADFRGAVLVEADLNGANLKMANLSGAILIKAHLSWADLSLVNLKRANLNKANLNGANLNRAILIEADLSYADLSHAVMVKSNLKNAKLTNCRIYGISPWDVKFSDNTEQQDLIITQQGQPTITVDNLEVAQFIYLLLHNEKIMSVIDSTGQKLVLILGRFTEERKVVLDAIRGKLRELGFVPMFFELEKPTQRDFTETIKTLARLSRFIIADITNPKSSPLELKAVVPDYMIPFVPICDENEEPFSVFQDLQNEYEWALKVLEYHSSDHLIEVMEDAIVNPAIEKAEQLKLKKESDLRGNAENKVIIENLKITSLASSEEGETYKQLAQIYEKRKDFSLALDNYRKVLELDPHDQDSLFFVGSRSYQEGQYDESIKCLESLLLSDADNITARIVLSLAYICMGSYDQAITTLSSLPTNNLAVSDTDSTNLSRAYYLIGACRLREGNLFDAKNYLINSLRFRKTDAAVKALAELYSIEGNQAFSSKLYENAKNFFEQALDLEAGSDSLRNKLQQVQKRLRLKRKTKVSALILVIGCIVILSVGYFDFNSGEGNKHVTLNKKEGSKLITVNKREGSKIITVKRDVYLRQGPDAKTPQVGTLTTNTSVVLIGSGTDYKGGIWNNVRVESGPLQGKVGYVKKFYLNGERTATPSPIQDIH